MSLIDPQSGPHTHSGANTNRIMLTVFIALAPALFYGIYNFGWPAFNLLLVTLLTIYASEFVSLYLMKKPLTPSITDGSALLTGCLLAMSLPPWAPWWIGVFGGAFAIFIGKHIFGGIGQNVFNPAMLSRVALLVAFPLEMTTWVKPHPLNGENSPGFMESLDITFGSGIDIDSMSCASVLGEIKTGFTQGHSIEQGLSHVDYDTLNALWGSTGGSLGETSAILILLGGLFLIYKRIISWHIPFSMLITFAVIATIFNLVNPDRYLDYSLHILNGGLLLGAFFIATDPVTSPSTRGGQIIFGCGCGFLDFVIRTWGGYPEGIGFSVLLMNAVTPLIDHYIKPRIYGRDRRGRPQTIKTEAGEE